MISAPPLTPLPTVCADDELGTLLARQELSGWTDITVRILRPFSWDAKHRGLTVVTLPVAENTDRLLVCGPYATADAAAWNVDRTWRVPFPNDPTTDAVAYLALGTPPAVADRFQDCAGWFTIAARNAEGHPVALAAAVDRSDTLVLRVSGDRDHARLDLIAPAAVAEPRAVRARPVHPRLHVAHTNGGHDSAHAVLRTALSAVIPTAHRDASTPLIADTWGFGTAITGDIVDDFISAAADLGADIVTLDKGWSAAVGDWEASSAYPAGIAGIAQSLADRGMQLGLWLGVGNADPWSRIAHEHPEWIAQWRGVQQTVSHRTHQLCVGHEAVRHAIAEAIDRLVANGLAWILHDFETISRCDAAHHDHDPGDGEHDAVTGWYELLRGVRARHPHVRIENCWNGARPLDLQMIAHHDTTIGDDWCDTEHAITAKLGLGHYLPASWCSAYMADEVGRPDRAALAVFAVGGPWVLMGNLAAWDDEQRARASRAIATYRHWSPRLSRLYVEASPIDDDGGDRLPPAVQGIQLRDGAEMVVAIVVGADGVGKHSEWTAPDGSTVLAFVDEFTGEARRWDPEVAPMRISIPTDEPDGHLWSLRLGLTKPVTA